MNIPENIMNAILALKEGSAIFQILAFLIILLMVCFLRRNDLLVRHEPKKSPFDILKTDSLENSPVVSKKI